MKRKPIKKNAARPFFVQSAREMNLFQQPYSRKYVFRTKAPILIRGKKSKYCTTGHEKIKPLSENKLKQKLTMMTRSENRTLRILFLINREVKNKRITFKKTNSFKRKKFFYSFN